MSKRKPDPFSVSSSVELPLDAIGPNPWQARRVFGEPEIRNLAESISEVGQIQPIVVRNVQNSGAYQLVAGERRLRAHKLLARPTISAVIIEATDEAAAAIALAENIERESLTDYEVALAIRNIERQFSNRTSLARSLGMARSDLYRYLAFFHLPGFILSDLDQEPTILGRAAASGIASTLSGIRDRPGVEEALSKVWTNIKSHKLDQGKVAEAILSEIHGRKPPEQRSDVKELYVGGKLVARLVAERTKLTIEIKTNLLGPGKETQLRKAIEELIMD